MEGEINLLDYWRVLRNYKKLISSIVGGTVFFSVIYSFTLPSVYEVTATLMPMGGRGGGVYSVGFNPMGLAGLFGQGGTNNANSRLFAILRSRTLSERIVERHDLMKVLFQDKWDPERQAWKTGQGEAPATVESAAEILRGAAHFDSDPETSLLLVTVRLGDPREAAEVANLFVKELAASLSETAFTTAKRNRIFIEGQLQKNKKELLGAGKQLANFYADGKISNVVSTLDVDLSNPDEEPHPGQPGWEEPLLEEDDLTKEVLKIPSTPGLPGVREAFADVQKKKEDLEKGLREVDEKLKGANIVEQVPQQVYLQYLTTRRQLLGQLYTLLSNQYEMAKIDEAREDLGFQIVDWARPSKHHYKPNRKQIVMIFFLASIFVSVFAAFFLNYLKKMKSQPQAS